MEHAKQQVDHEHYRQTGHLVLAGYLGTAPVHVAITPYAQGRMKFRDIDASEVLETLALPRSSHSAGKTEGRFEVEGKTNRGRLRVIYEGPHSKAVLVITTYPELD